MDRNYSQVNIKRHGYVTQVLLSLDKNEIEIVRAKLSELSLIT